MRAGKSPPGQSQPTDQERAWLRTFMRIIRISPTLVRPPDLVDREINRRYNLGLNLDRPKDPSETQRIAARKFCESVSVQRLASLMRDDELRVEFRELLAEVPLVREVFQEEGPALLGLIDSDPPQLRAVSQAGPEL